MTQAANLQRASLLAVMEGVTDFHVRDERAPLLCDFVPL